jgi:tetratricopeptide (TPR) repeat protein
MGTIEALLRARGWRGVVLVVGAACLGTLACPEAPPPALTPAAAKGPPTDVAAATGLAVTESRPHAIALARRGLRDPAIAPLDGRVAALKAHVERAGGAPSPSDLEILSSLYLERARLSGDYDDYGRAEDALEVAIRHSPPGGGPLLARAQLSYAVHRLARASADLDAAERWVIKRPAEADVIARLRTDIAFHSGQYALARRRYGKELAARPSAERAVALAQLEWKTGHFDRAEALFAKARALAAGADPPLRAWLALSEGMMELDRGRFEAAIRCFDRGLADRPRAWALEEHRAEALASLGREEEALPIYLDLVARVADPEFMDAAAQIYEKQGDAEAARALVAAARAGYEKRLQRFPEATAGHALDFFLRRDPPAALPVAELNAKARPGGEAAVLLARAYLANGRPAEARRIVEATLATEWRTADLHAVAADTFAALGDPRAPRERKKALALNPHVFE